ncbi:hypothetical protein [Methylobacterium sp. J-068]|uniref:hypothetical protein n=1 Tax=Methylobacterium sp. J-068 TaxID=2836649 RepID=UPI001FB93C5E|nr:hypothetical protein [Methylobacterium sp. J-068]MCJ2036911.1 hypothetical protein [Methylobacterium sp. J-068]
MSISSIGAVPAFRGTGAGPSPIPPVQPVQAPAPLAPAVRVDIQSQERGSDPRFGTRPAPSQEAKAGAAAAEPRIRIDQDTKTVVYQEVDPSSGDVVIQLPDPVVLKARAYAEASEMRAHPAGRPLDRTA